LEAALSRVDDLDRTLALMARFGAPVVLCEPGTKAPCRRPDDEWQTTTDPAEVRAHVAGGGNIALMTGRQAGLAVFDPDRPEPWERIVRRYGPPAPEWVETGSGRRHAYARWEPDLPAKLRDGAGAIIGEIQRGGADGTRRQAVMLPPSRHPSGAPYAWLVDPERAPVEPIPREWRQWLWHSTPAHLRLLNGAPLGTGRAGQTTARTYRAWTARRW
jgi:hypothetical protein